MLQPSIGLIFWTTVCFLILMFLLKKYAWKPVMGAIESREDSIREALSAAEKAREDVANIAADNEKVLAEARAERDAMLKDARQMKDAIVGEAQDAAKKEAEKIMTSAREAIELEKQAAMVEMKNTIATISLEIAEQILRKELKDSGKQEAHVSELMQEINLN